MFFPPADDTIKIKQHTFYVSPTTSREIYKMSVKQREMRENESQSEKYMEMRENKGRLRHRKSMTLVKKY